MELGKRTIEFDDVVRIRPISDAHIGARACEEKRLKRDIESIVNDPDCYSVLLGDQMECITRQDLRRFQVKSVREDLIEEADSLLNAQLREGIRFFKPLADTGRLLGAIRGNHEEDVKRLYSFDIHMEFCERLNIPDLGLSCMMRLTMKKRAGSTRNLILLMHHGHGGGGIYTGASINRMEQVLSGFDADVVLFGHNHKNHVSKKTRLSMTTSGVPRLIEKEVVLMRCGSYYKTYQKGSSNYGERAGYPPVKIGGPPILTIGMGGKNHELWMKVEQ